MSYRPLPHRVWLRAKARLRMTWRGLKLYAWLRFHRHVWTDEQAFPVRGDVLTVTTIRQCVKCLKQEVQ